MSIFTSRHLHLKGPVVRHVPDSAPPTVAIVALLIDPFEDNGQWTPEENPGIVAEYIETCPAHEQAIHTDLLQSAQRWADATLMRLGSPVPDHERPEIFVDDAQPVDHITALDPNDDAFDAGWRPDGPVNLATHEIVTHLVIPSSGPAFDRQRHETNNRQTHSLLWPGV